MKAKKLNKKLSLKKRTVAHLKDGEMKLFMGGYVLTDFPCLFTETCTCINTCNNCI